MTRFELIERLQNYRDTVTKADMLRFRLRKMEDSYSVLTDDGIAGAQLASKPITDMPIYHGMPGSTVERVAALRERATESQMAEIQRCFAELELLVKEKEMLDILIKSLNERERFIIQTHLINGLNWRDTAHRYAISFVDELTENALKYVQTQALDKMLTYTEDINIESP